MLHRVDAVKLKELPGPEDFAALEVELPSADLGDFFGMF